MVRGVRGEECGGSGAKTCARAAAEECHGTPLISCIRRRPAWAAAGTMAEPAPDPDAARVGAAGAPPDAVVDAAWQQAMARLTRSEELCDVVFVVGGERLPALRQLCA